MIEVVSAVEIIVVIIISLQCRRVKARLGDRLSVVRRGLACVEALPACRHSWRSRDHQQEEIA